MRPLRGIAHDDLGQARARIEPHEEDIGLRLFAREIVPDAHRKDGLVANVAGHDRDPTCDVVRLFLRAALRRSHRDAVHPDLEFFEPKRCRLLPVVADLCQRGRFAEQGGRIEDRVGTHWHRPCGRGRERLQGERHHGERRAEATVGARAVYREKSRNLGPRRVVAQVIAPACVQPGVHEPVAPECGVFDRRALQSPHDRVVQLAQAALSRERAKTDLHVLVARDVVRAELGGRPGCENGLGQSDHDPHRLVEDGAVSDLPHALRSRFPQQPELLLRQHAGFRRPDLALVVRDGRHRALARAAVIGAAIVAFPDEPLLYLTNGVRRRGDAVAVRGAGLPRHLARCCGEVRKQGAAILCRRALERQDQQ